MSLPPRDVHLVVVVLLDVVRPRPVGRGPPATVYVNCTDAVPSTARGAVDLPPFRAGAPLELALHFLFKDDVYLALDCLLNPDKKRLACPPRPRHLGISASLPS